MGAALHCGVWAYHCGGFFHRGAQALGTRASVGVAHRPSCSAESSQTRDGTCVPYTGTWILIHCTTREVPHCGFDFLSLMFSDVEYLFIYLVAIYMSSLEKYILKLFLIFYLGYFSAAKL